jgi:hypothetical protein
MPKLNRLELLRRSRIWVQENPSEILQLLLIFLLGIVVLTAVAFTLIIRPPSMEPPLAPVTGTKTTTGWNFVARVPAGKDYCDMYTKGGIGRSKCFTQDKTGKWRFSNVY